MEKPPFWNILNDAYHMVFPDPQKSTADASIQAFGLGAMFTNAGIKAGEAISTFIDRTKWPGFDHNVTFTLEGLVTLGVPAAIATAFLSDTVFHTHLYSQVKELVRNHPVYSSGLAGIYASIAYNTFEHRIQTGHFEHVAVPEEDRVYVNDIKIQ